MASQSDETDDTFPIDPEFYADCTALLGKYSTPLHSFTIRDLARDVQETFRCEAVAILRPGDPQSLVLSCSASSSEGRVRRLLRSVEVAKAIGELAAANEYVRGLKIERRIAPKKTGKIVLDLIRLDDLSTAGEQGAPFRIFMLVDAANLALLKKQEESGHESQCRVIARFLYGCWAELSVPVCRSRPGDGASATEWVLANRLRTATLAELIDEATRSAGEINTYNDGRGKEAYFEYETKGPAARFDWPSWLPRWSASRTQEEQDLLQEQGRSLVYWRRWNESHHRLEDELAWSGAMLHAGAPTSEKSKSVGSKAEKDPLTCKEPYPIARWVQKQRNNTAPILRRLGDLQKMASDAFLTQGRSPFRAPAGEAQLPSLSRNSLLIYGLSRWLAPEGQLQRQLTDPACSDVDFCRTLHAVAVVGQYLLGGEHKEQSFIHRLIQLVAFYGHAALGIPDRIDLRAHLLQAARGEPALHALKPFYRDHFYHVLQVCLLGHLLLETEIGEGKRLWELVAVHLQVPGNKTRVLRLWYLAALLHDIGYAMDVLGSSRDLLGFFKHSEALKQMDKSFSEAVAALRKSKEVRDLGVVIGEQDGEQNQGVERDHGIVSALHLNSLLEHIARDDKSLDRSQYAPAVQAIAYHNLRRNSDIISFAKEPLAFLLALCDEVQEWRRPRLSYSTSPEWLLARMGEDAPDITDIEGPFESLKLGTAWSRGKGGDVTFSIPSSGGAEMPRLTLELSYDSQINRNSELFNLWLNATLNFQRLRCDGLPLDIVVTYETPCYFFQEQGKVRETQLHRLRDAAYDTHMPFLARWFPSGEGPSATGVSWTDKDEHGVVNGYERLELDVRKLSRNTLITQDMSTFRKRLQQWKRYNDDRDFPGDYGAGAPE